METPTNFAEPITKESFFTTNFDVSSAKSSINGDENDFGCFKTPFLPFAQLPSTSKIVSSSLKSGSKQNFKYDIYSSSRTQTGQRSVAGSTKVISARSYVVVAIVEGRGVAKGEIGLASMDVRHPELCLAQFADTASYTKLRITLQTLNPVEIIVPDTAIERGGNMLALFSLLKEDLPRTQISPVPRKHFSENQALEAIRSLKTVDCSTVEKDVAEKYYCLACAAALLAYVEHIQNIVFAPSSMRIVFKGVEKTCMIDPTTAKNLELIVSLKDVTNTEASLYGVLNRTFTVGGQRMLRASILQPSADLNVIEQRLDAIEELLSNENTFTSLRSLISRMLDVDQLVALCSYINNVETVKTAEYKITQLIYLKHTLELVEPLRDSLGTLNSALFRKFFELLTDDRFESILNCIKSIMSEEVRIEKTALNMKMQKCYAVKTNINGLLDITRRTYSELVNDVDELCYNISQETFFPFKVTYATGRGFYLSVYMKDGCFPKQPPDILINVIRRNNLITCTTRDLVRLNDRINEVFGEILILSNIIVCECLTNIREFITCLFNLTEVISSVDVLTCLAYFCTISTSSMKRPVFMDSVAIQQAVHPILEKFSTSHVTPNDVHISPDANFVIITGPNMAGKSTYLKMIALQQIVAQMGSYVPAKWAVFRLTDQIFSRIGHNDDLENNLSAFQVEMTDVKYILENLSDDSFVIIDELCRSTSAEEGLALCYAISEHFIERNAFVVLSTHFLDLATLDSLYANVSNFHFGSQSGVSNSMESAHLVLNHTLKRGAYRGPLYGFEIAALSSMPKEVILKARQLAEEIHSKRQASVEVEETKIRKERAILKLGRKLLQATVRDSKVDKEESRTYLKNLKNLFLEEISELPNV